jgi:N-acetylmuramoyl-L-alanine amidase
MIINIFLRWCAVLALVALGACAQLPVRTNLPVEQRPSPNFNERQPNFVIIHHTSNDSAEPALRTLTSPAAQVSSHYLIARDGKIIYLVDEAVRAWHAGESYWGGNRDLNSSSIGIELDNNGNEPFAEPMMQSLLALLADLKARYKIPAANFLAHGDIAPGRKTDPSRWFPWKRLADAGYGVWCEPPFPGAPSGQDDAVLLIAFGYDVSNLEAAVGAFRRRFLAQDSASPLTEYDRALLYCLIMRKTER